MNKEWEEYLKLKEVSPELFEFNNDVDIILDYDIVQQYERNNNLKIGLIYRSAFHTLVIDLVRMDGKLCTYERVLKSGGSGVVMICRYEKNYVLLEQFRHSVRKSVLSFPRGFGESGLTMEENARKEINEELNAEVINSHFLGYLYTDPGMTDDKPGILLCDITEPQIMNDYEGIISYQLVSEKVIDKYISDGIIQDALTIAAWEIKKEYIKDKSTNSLS